MKQKKPDICVFLDYFYPVSGGLALSSFYTYSLLTKNGWNITVHTTKDTHTERNTLPSTEKVNGIRIIRHSHLMYNLNPFPFFSVLHKDHIVILHEFITLPYYFFYCYLLLLKMLGKKRCTLILSCHGVFNSSPSYYKGLERIKRTMKRFLDRSVGVFLVNNTVDAVRAVSKREKLGLEKGGVKVEIRVIENGLDGEAFKGIEGKASEDIHKKVVSWRPYIFQMGRMDRTKNFETAIRAIAFVPPPVRLIILGTQADKAYKKDLTSLIDHLGVQDRVEFAGVIEGTDKYYFMRSAVCEVHLARFESFGNVIQEAISQGCLCIVAKDTTPADIVETTGAGFSVSPDDAVGAANQIRFLLDHGDSKEVQHMKQQAVQSMKERSWNNVTKEIERFYGNIYTSN